MPFAQARNFCTVEIKCERKGEEVKNCDKERQKKEERMVLFRLVNRVNGHEAIEFGPHGKVPDKRCKENRTESVVNERDMGIV